MAATIFQELDREFEAEHAQAARLMDELRATLPPRHGGTAADDVLSRPSAVNRHEAVKALQTAAGRLGDIAATMEFEAHEQHPDQRAQAKQRAHACRKAAQAFEGGVGPMKTTATAADREELLARTQRSGPGAAAAPVGEDDQRKAQVAEGTEKLRGQKGKLQEAERLTVQMNEAADSTLVELKRQGETIRGISDKTRQSDEELSQVNQILRKMHKEMMRNKMMLAAIIAILVIIIVGVLYYKIGGIASSSDPNAVSEPAGPVTPGGPPATLPPDTPAPAGFLPVLPAAPVVHL